MCVSHNTIPVVTAVVWPRYNEALQIDQMMVVPPIIGLFYWKIISLHKWQAWVLYYNYERWSQTKMRSI